MLFPTDNGCSLDSTLCIARKKLVPSSSLPLHLFLQWCPQCCMQCPGCMRLRLLKDIAARKVWTLIFARISKMIQIPTQTSPQPEGKFWRKIRSFFSSSSLPQPLSKSIKRFLTIYGDEDSGIQVYNTFDPASTSVMVRAFGDSKLISRLFCIFVCFEFTISFFLSDRPPPPVQVGVIVIPSQMP